jgi:hypothetical protein
MMGAERVPDPEKLVCAFIYSDHDVYETAKKALIDRFGAIDFESDEMEFSHTKYYLKEMGCDLKRRFFSFAGLLDPGEMAGTKQFTNLIEGLHKKTGGGRLINIDPGFLSLAKFVLVTTKNFSHRIYIGKNMWAEITLVYDAQNGTFGPLAWTYPEYSRQDIIMIFNEIRGILHGQFRHIKYSENAHKI